MKILNDIIPKKQNNEDESANILTAQEGVAPRIDNNTSVQTPEETTTSFTKESIQKIEKMESALNDNPFLLRYAKHTVSENGAENSQPSKVFTSANEETPSPVVSSNIPTTKSADYGYVGKIKRSSGGKRFLRWTLALLSVAVLVSAFMYTTSKSEIVVHPKVKNISVENTNLDIALTSEEDYYTLTKEVEETEKILSDGSTTESQAATGRVVLYNAYSTSKQNLLIDTRLETPDGLIFKTKTAVTIPGYTTSAGKVVPGQVEVDVYAESTGEKYNIPLTDFKIFGFKSNKDKYEKFYARSLTPMEGGSEGLVYTLSDAKRDESISLMTARAIERVESKLVNEIPEGYVAIMSTKSVSEPIIEGSNKSTDIDIEQKVKVSASVKVLREDLFVSAISKEEDNSMYEIKDISAMVLSPESTSSSSLSISANGVAVLVGDVNLEELHKSLVGQSVSEIENILEKYTQIEKIDAKLKPFWRKTLPGDPLKLEVKLAE